MKKRESTPDETGSVDTERREFLATAGKGAIGATMLGGVGISLAQEEEVAEPAAPASTALRWGVVGTGGIANSMARMMAIADNTELVAVSSRRMRSANEFAGKYELEHAFDAWAAMAESDVVDAIYIATPTSVREEIALAAAAGGKHVLGEKPFASADSVRRIADACRAAGVGFMDGTHFPHHPRTRHIQDVRSDEIGWPWSVASAFQFNLADRKNIRFNTELEPMGAIGDAGWYNMRAAVEYLSPDVELVEMEAFLRRDEETGAAISGSGVMRFDDGSTSTWNCGFDSGGVIMDLRITGGRGVVSVDNYLSQDQDGSGSYTIRRGGWGPNAVRRKATVNSEKPGAALMFSDFAKMVGDPEAIERSIRATERTQAWLDAAWASAIARESAS
jgi:predicted dehydrogenase